MNESTVLSRIGIRGSIPALVTPMHPDGSLDLASLGHLIDWHIEQGTNAIVVMGSTAESATLSTEEHMEVIRYAVQHTAKRIPVIAGTGSNSTQEAIELTEYAHHVGADAILSITPYYNRPTQEGLFRHFAAIASTVEIPLIVYNVPSRTGVDLADETILRLARLPNIAGLKDATGDIGRGIRLIEALPFEFSVFSGDDATAAALMLLGAKGNISVTANITPALMSQLCVAASMGHGGAVRLINRRLAPLNEALFIETNPIPVKWALAQMGKISLAYRAPLWPLADEHHELLTFALNRADIVITTPERTEKHVSRDATRV